MFQRDYELIPRTYSLKSYKRRGSSWTRKFLIFLTGLVILASLATVAVMSLTDIFQKGST